MKKVMKKFIVLWIFFCWGMPLAANRINGEQSFVIIIPSYNNAQWYKKNLDSVFLQNYNNYRVIYIDDCSSDGTGDLVEAYIREHDSADKIMLIRNEKRLGSPLANEYKVIHQEDRCYGFNIKNNDVVVLLDGDDWLAQSEALSILNDAYKNPKVWMTYGNFHTSDDLITTHVKKVATKVLQTGKIRDYKWAVSHLRTFYAGLFRRVNKVSLQKNGNFFTVANDAAVNFSLIELAGLHAKFIPEALYIYNINNPLSDFRLYPDRQQEVCNYIRTMKRYKLLKKLF
jgi:glycosyltransferase involved in cell wall biosynthesis